MSFEPYLLCANMRMETTDVVKTATRLPWLEHSDIFIALGDQEKDLKAFDRAEPY